MLHIIGFILLGYLVMINGGPVKFAGIYTLGILLLTISDGIKVIELVVSSAFIFGFTVTIYVVIDFFDDKIVAPMSILIGGAFILFLAGWL